MTIDEWKGKLGMDPGSPHSTDDTNQKLVDIPSSYPKGATFPPGIFIKWTSHEDLARKYLQGYDEWKKSQEKNKKGKD